VQLAGCSMRHAETAAPVKLNPPAQPARPLAFFDPGVVTRWRQGMMCGVKAAYDCIKAFSETDFTEDLKKIDLPTLIMHGDDDHIVPIGASAMLSSKLVRTPSSRSTRACLMGWPRRTTT